MSKFASRKFIAMLLTAAANIAILFGAPEALRDQIPVVLVIVDSFAGLYVFVQGWIDRAGVIK